MPQMSINGQLVSLVISSSHKILPKAKQNP